MAAALLGEDGRGYELARRLEACGAWRTWLGEAAYAVFFPALSSPSAWDAFLSPRVAGAGSAPPVRAQIQLQLQLRARALLYDKASASLFLSQSHSINDINPNFLQLHGDDVYFSLDEEKEDGSQLQSQSAFNTDSSNPTSTTKWPTTWYKQFAEKFRIRHHKLPSGEKEITKRTPEGMLTYLKLSTVHKRKRQVFKDYQSPGDPISLTDETLFPEMFFPADCVPDSALPKADCTPKRAKPEFHTVLDNLPSLPTRSPAMIERFGILPEYYKSGPKSLPTKALSPEQENLLAKKAVVRLVLSVGFEGGSGGAVEVLGEVVGRKGRELGKMLRVLSDGYRKECSSVELLKMFLKVSGYSIGGLAEITKCGNNNSNNNNNHNRALSHQMQQQHSHSLQSQHPNNIFNAQQRQFHPHAQIQNLAFQQQQQQLQQQQQQQQQIQQQLRRNNNNNNNNNTNNNNQMKTHNPLVDVKIESSAQMDLAQHQMDGFGGNNNTINNNNNNNNVNNSGRNQQQLRFQQHQMMMVNNNNSNINNNINNNIVQSGPQQQFKPMQSVQISQLQAQNVYGMRPAPVKVEAFHELVSGDNEHSKMLTSPK